jgi:hypothetical protein
MSRGRTERFLKQLIPVRRDQLIVLCTGVLLLTAASAEDVDAFLPKVLPLQTYEPNVIGYTKDSDDVGFIDFTLSVKYPIMPVTLAKGWGEDNRLYFTFTGRFGFYAGTRESSPVIAKRFNPKLLFEHSLREDGGVFRSSGSTELRRRSGVQPATYIAFAYAHESNGQAIHTAGQYQEAVRTAERPEFANDYISRGWDYLEVATKAVPHETRTDKVSLYASGKFFLSHGLFQGRPEEVYPWESTTEGKARKEVDGLSFVVKYQYDLQKSPAIGDTKLAAVYTTGYDGIGRHNTFRLEAGVQVFQVPLAVWYQNGYLSDLALYYTRVSSIGFGLEIGAF